jgi:cellulose synthase/poly-beta-1,6-N-acetylglucosamine synthase-like glycosyltransferase
VPLRLEVAETRIPIGEARNRGVAAANAPHVAFLSADARASPKWVEEALSALENNDMVFGQQMHAPGRATVGAAVRGLRYHFPDSPSSDPTRYASNVNAAFRRDLLRAFPFDPATNASEDLLLAKRAYRAGYHATYQPGMVVHHADVDSAHAELRKNLREGESWARYASTFGLHMSVLAWGGLLLASTTLFALSPGGETGALLLASAWAPTLRRALRRHRKMAPKLLALGIAASPAFDLAFLMAYLGGFLKPRQAGQEPGQPPRVEG